MGDLSQGAKRARDRARRAASVRAESSSDALLVRLTDVLASDVAPEAMVQRVADEVAASLGAEFGAYLVNALEPVAPPLETNGASSTAVAWLASGAPALRDAFFEATFRHGKSARWSNADDGASTAAAPRRALLAVPVKLRGGEVHGCLVFATSRSEALDTRAEGHARFAATVAAMAVENARCTRNQENVLEVLTQDLKNPLASVINDVGIVLKSLSPDAHVARQRLEDVWRKSERMFAFLQSFVDLTQLEAGTVSFDIKQHDPSALVLEALEANRSALAEKGLSVMRAAPPRLSALCDRKRIVHVLARLIANAVRVTPPGGRVTLHVDALPGEVRVGVGDGGPPMPPVLLERLLAGDTRDRDRDGYAIGLSAAVVRAVVFAHGGRFWGESRPTGMAFYLTLPSGG